MKLIKSALIISLFLTPIVFGMDQPMTEEQQVQRAIWLSSQQAQPAQTGMTIQKALQRAERHFLLTMPDQVSALKKIAVPKILALGASISEEALNQILTDTLAAYIQQITHAQPTDTDAQLAQALAESQKEEAARQTKLMDQQDAGFAAALAASEKEAVTDAQRRIQQSAAKAAQIADDLKNLQPLQKPIATATTATPKPSKKPIPPFAFTTLQATSQQGVRFGGGSCGAHALNNAAALQRLVNAQQPITSQGMQKNMACFYIPEEALSNQAIRQQARTNNLNNLWILGRANNLSNYANLKLQPDQIIPINEKTLSPSRVTWQTVNGVEVPGTRRTISQPPVLDDTIRKEIKAGLQQLKQSPSGALHFVCSIISGYGSKTNTDHWVLISAIKINGKTTIYYVDSNNQPPHADAKGFLKYIHTMVHQ